MITHPSFIGHPSQVPDVVMDRNIQLIRLIYVNYMYV